MTELDNIKNILNKQLKNDDTFSPDDLDRLAEIFHRIVKVNGSISELKLLDDATLDYLKNRNIINRQQVDYISTYRYIVCDYNGSLEQSSINILKGIIEQIISSIKVINEQVENKEIRELLDVVDNNFYNVTNEQLDLLFSTINESNYSLEEKRNMFVYISMNAIKYGDELLLEEEEEEKEESKGISIGDCTELFARYGYDFNRLSNANKLRITMNGVYEKIDCCFKVLQDNNINLNYNCGVDILDKKQDQICEILIKSNPICIEKIIEMCKQNDFVKDGVVKFYVMVESPSDFIFRKREYKPKKYSGIGGDGGSSEVGCHQDYIANVEYFSEICNRIYDGRVNFFKRIYELTDRAALLGYPHKRVLEIGRILKTYGFSEEDFLESATSVFATTHHADVLDLAVELGVLDYLKNNRSRFSLSVEDELFDLLYVASLNKNIAFSPKATTNFGGEKSQKYVLNAARLRRLLSEIKIPKGISAIAHNKEMFDIFEERLTNSEFSIDEALDMANSEELNPVKVLETNFKKDDLVYEINGIRISRYKVLRIYSSLNGIEIDPAKGTYNMILYALTRNSYLTQEQVISLAHTYKKAEEEMKGRSL